MARMREAGVRPDVYSYNTLLSACAAAAADARVPPRNGVLPPSVYYCRLSIIRITGRVSCGFLLFSPRIRHFRQRIKVMFQKSQMCTCTTRASPRARPLPPMHASLPVTAFLSFALAVHTRL